MEFSECHHLPVEHIISQLETHLERGLTQNEAQARLEKVWP